MSEVLMEVRNLKKYFPVTAGILRRQVASVKAVDGVDFTIHSGEVLGLVGETGSGKSTIGRTVIRLIEPTGGEIFFMGKDLLVQTPSEMKKIRKDVQIVFQDPYASLNPRKTIGDNIGESLLYHGMVQNRAQQNEKVAEILRRIGLSPDAMKRYPHQFSGGQQQRICIGRAIAMEPKLIVCDEALSALDVSVQAQIMNLLMELKDTLGLSYLFISHDLNTVKHVCDRVIVLYLGKIMEVANTAELFRNPKHPYTQALLSATPRLHPGEKKQRVILTGEIPSALNPPSGCPFRTRCPYAQPICAEPPPCKGTEEHYYNCILD
jgi:oligopeptide transport system ATP-binding protein